MLSIAFRPSSPEEREETPPQTGRVPIRPLSNRSKQDVPILHRPSPHPNCVVQPVPGSAFPCCFKLTRGELSGLLSAEDYRTSFYRDQSVASAFLTILLYHFSCFRANKGPSRHIWRKEGQSLTTSNILGQSER